ncbi:hypothetical protein EVAR_90990_1 [Eumeta japonica]|uniref:Uncharacterized protein n=1 Tax=Eumeta variegata TaxID=151549 RepID=A0A4C1T525_EUMVA|nr:hypothetical protein EVAR_90990_1 [Eumeta japonica]
MLLGTEEEYSEPFAKQWIFITDSAPKSFRGVVLNSDSILVSDDISKSDSYILFDILSGFQVGEAWSCTFHSYALAFVLGLSTTLLPGRRYGTEGLNIASCPALLVGDATPTTKVAMGTRAAQTAWQCGTPA